MLVTMRPRLQHTGYAMLSQQPRLPSGRSQLLIVAVEIWMDDHLRSNYNYSLSVEFLSTAFSWQSPDVSLVCAELCK